MENTLQISVRAVECGSMQLRLCFSHRRLYFLMNLFAELSQVRHSELKHLKSNQVANAGPRLLAIQARKQLFIFSKLIPAQQVT